MLSTRLSGLLCPLVGDHALAQADALLMPDRGYFPRLALQDPAGAKP